CRPTARSSPAATSARCARTSRAGRICDDGAVAVEYLIEGDRAALGTLRRDLAPTYAAWMNRVDVRRSLPHLGLFDREAQEARLAEQAKANAQRQPEEVGFTIYDRRDGEAVGTSSLFRIDHHHLRATFGILLGER